MKVGIYELYPVYKIEPDSTVYWETHSRKEVDISPELFEEYQKAHDAFFDIQNKLEDLYDNTN